MQNRHTEYGKQGEHETKRKADFHICVEGVGHKSYDGRA